MKTFEKYTIRQLDIMYANLERGNPIKAEIQAELDRRLAVIDELSAKRNAKSQSGS